MPQYKLVNIDADVYKDSMKRKSRTYKLLHPHWPTRSAHNSKDNIFCATIYEEAENDRQQMDRFVVGARQVRIYKNRMTRKQKLTIGIFENRCSNDISSMNSSGLMSCDEVTNCLPKINSSASSENNLMKSIKSIKKIQFKEQKEVLKNSVIYHSESSLQRSADKYRQTIENRQKSRKLNFLPNIRSLEWTQSLRNSRRKMNMEHIEKGRKMIICGKSKRKVENEWIRTKQNQGYAFQLLPQTFIKERNHVLHDS